MPDSGVHVSGARVILVGISNFSRLDFRPCSDRVFNTAWTDTKKFKQDNSKGGRPTFKDITKHKIWRGQQINRLSTGPL